jgi:tryptophan-rich sensory protein
MQSIHSHSAHHDQHPHAAAALRSNLNVTAFWATLHCLSGCAVGEVLGMVIGTAIGLSNGATIALAIVLAFAFGYTFTMVPLRRAGMGWRQVLRLALAADTASIAIMEVVDNAAMLMIPGAMDAGLASPWFWGSLAVSLLVAGAAAYPVNRWLIARGKGHAVVHRHHAH